MDKSGIGTYTNESYELATSSLDLFTVPPVDVSQIHGKTVTIYPSSVLTDDGPFDFRIPESSDFTYLPMCRLEGLIEVVKTDGTALAATENISVVNLLPQSLFRQVECTINEEYQINDLSTPSYAYKSFIETHLNFNREMKETSLKACEMYIKDTVSKENELMTTAHYTDGAAYNGSAVRSKLIHGKKIPFSIIVHVDFLQANRYLIPNCSVKLRFIRNEDKFSLLCSTLKAKIKIHKLRLTVRRVTIDPSISSAVEQKLRQGDVCLYPVASSKIKTHLINKGHTNEIISQVFSGKLPRTIIIGFVKDKSYHGSVDTNPFVFENFGLNYLNLLVDGEPINSSPFQPDYEGNDAIREYRWLFDNIGLYHVRTNGLTYEEFKSNSNFYAYDLTPDLCNSFDMHGNQNSTLDLHIGFKTALAENVNCVVFATFNEVVTIDADRKVNIV
jgi:hypothetical protein